VQSEPSSKRVPSLTLALVCASSLLSPSLAAAAGKPSLPKPTVPPPTAWHPPTPSSGSAAGVRVVVMPSHTLPLVHLAITVQAGSSLDPPGKAGLASLTARMLEEGGAGQRSGSDVSGALEDLGAELHVHVDEESATFFLSVLSSKLDRALGVMGDMLARPRFDAAEWPHVRARQIAELTKDQDEPRKVSETVFLRALFGDHPYGHSELGSRDAVEKLSLDDVKSFWKSHYGPRPTTVVLVGDATQEGASKAVAAAFAGWSSTVAPPPPPKEPVGPAATRLVLVDRPGAPQSALRVGRLGASWSIPPAEYAALTTLEMLLGGSFTSRLTQNLREKHGYTYGAHDNFQMDRATGWYEIETSVRTDATAESIAEIWKELAAIRQPIPAEELAKGRALVAQKVVESYGQGTQLALELADLVSRDRPLDTDARLVGDLQKLDAATVTRVADRQLDDKAWIIVVVGDRKVIEPKLRALPMGKSLELRDAEGNVLK
jgi:predicted Zn-dependent peptidase